MIAQAKRIDSGEYVEGYVKNCTDTGLDVFWIQTKEWIDYQINPSTLKYSFNGIDFYSEEFIKELLEDAKHLRSCEEQCEIYGL